MSPQAAPAFQAGTSPVGLIAGLLVLALLGDACLRFLRRGRLLAPEGVAEQAGLRVLLALAAVPWVCVALDLTGVAITRFSLAIVAAALALAAFAIDRRGARRAPPRGGAGPALSPAALALAAASASLVAFSLVHTSLYPPRTYDGLVGYDLVGKIMAREGALRSSVFTRLVFNAQCVYPPFTATNEGFWYLFHPALPQLWVPLVAAGFALVAWARVRRWTGSPTAAGLAVFLMLTPPELAFHLTVGQTDLASMAYTALGIFSWVEWRRGRGRLGEVALFLLLATTVRSENALFALALALAGVVTRGWRRGRAAWVLAPAALWFAFWNLVFVRGLIGYDPGRHFRSTVDIDPGRLLQVLAFAARNVANPATFGEVVVLIPLTFLLWGWGRWGRRLPARAGVPDPGLTAPLLIALAASFVCYLPFFYQWDPELNPLWSMDHTFKRGFFRFVPGLVTALLVTPPVLALVRRCDGPEARHG